MCQDTAGYGPICESTGHKGSEEKPTDCANIQEWGSKHCVRDRTVTTLRRRLAAFFLCCGSSWFTHPGSTRAHLARSFPTLSRTPFSQRRWRSNGESVRPADRWRCSSKPLPSTTCPDEKVVPLNGVSRSEPQIKNRGYRHCAEADLGRPYSSWRRRPAITDAKCRLRPVEFSANSRRRRSLPWFPWRQTRRVLSVGIRRAEPVHGY